MQFVPDVGVKVTVDLLDLSLEFLTKLPQFLKVLSELENHTHTHRSLKQPNSKRSMCIYTASTIHARYLQVLLLLGFLWRRKDLRFAMRNTHLIGGRNNTNGMCDIINKAELTMLTIKLII